METNDIRLEHLSIGYATKKNDRIVAADINACIRNGELTCLLGTNGVGKSTLLRTLSGFQPKLGGHIFIGGTDIGTVSPRRLSRIVSVVLTERNDVQNLTVAELVGLGRTPYTGFWGRLSAEDRRKVEQAIELVGIQPLARRMTDTLSDGELQKAHIAKALAQDTPVILLDEPTAYLDYPSKVEIMRLLHRLSRDTGKTIFFSTHDLELAMQIADTLWLMKGDGKLSCGIPEDLALDGTLADFFTRKGIAFDTGTGCFRVEHDCTAEIRLQGDDPRTTLTRKALERNGIRGHADAASVCHIDTRTAAPDFILQTADGIRHRTRNIEGLLTLLKQTPPDTTH